MAACARLRRLPALLTVAGICAAVALVARPQAHAAAAAHPRIFLDRATLATLRARARADAPEWKALQARCSEYLHGKVEWPDGDHYPPDGSIGEGYQGDGYFPALLDVGLCHQVELGLDPALARAYGKKGVEVLERMSAPTGSHAPNPLRDSGYGVRFYGVGLAIGFDWLNDALDSALRVRVIAAIHRWLGAYERAGFERTFPQGNYFAGYYDAKAMAALALAGYDPAAGAMWHEWLVRVHGKLVRPYYARNLEGGGWPEGWNYGPESTVHMSWPVLAAQTARGIDLLHRRGAHYVFPLNAPRYLVYFTWPSLRTMDDSDDEYDGPNPGATHPWLVAVESGLLERWHGAFAPFFHSYARAVRSVQQGGELGPDWDLWQNFLFWNPRAPERNYRRLPRSYRARGIERVAMRSDWSTHAVWAAFKAGPYINYPDNGEEFFDKGSLAIVNGGRQFLVNAPAALLRDTPGTNDGSDYSNRVYDDLFADTGSRDLFNIFYVDRPAPPGQGTRLRSDGARTGIDRYSDTGALVYARGTHLEDLYPRDPGATRTVDRWTRELVYLRPSTFVVVDRTQIADRALDQWLAWHVRRKPVARGSGMFEIGSGPGGAGTVQAVLPAGVQGKVVDVFGSHKVYRLELRPGTRSRGLVWVTVFDAERAGTPTLSSRPLAGTSPNVTGTVLSRSSTATVVASIATPNEIRYDAPHGPVLHILTGLVPRKSYAVSAAARGSQVRVVVRSGAGRRANLAGILVFRTTAGRLTP